MRLNILQLLLNVNLIIISKTPSTTLLNALCRLFQEKAQTTKAVQRVRAFREACKRTDFSPLVTKAALAQPPLVQRCEPPGKANILLHKQIALKTRQTQSADNKCNAAAQSTH